MNEPIDPKTLSPDTRAILQALDRNWMWRGIGIGMGISIWAGVLAIVGFLILSGR